LNYIGAKTKLLPFLHQCIEKEIGDSLKSAVFCDLFAGTGTVAKSFKTKVKKVIANDLEYYSYTLLRHYVGNNQILSADTYFEKLNALEGELGFISNHYGEGGAANRSYFSQENARKIDAIRQQIEAWKPAIDDQLFYFLLASFIESVDKVANTASVYGAFLKHIKKTARKPLLIEPAETVVAECTTEVYQEDANVLVQNISGDILYLDPPYNARQYGANYHILNTLAEYKKFEPKGITGLPHYNKSLYCSKRTVEDALVQLLDAAQFKHIFLSYNNEGLISAKRLENLLSEYGAVKRYTTNYQRFKADKDSNRAHKATSTQEFLFYLCKRS
jgi:adenine-specific DNA-methyltransferase